jgi:sugar O-acyltransferase (sialic acid O-acetyltransferase NeuD family)
LTGNLAVLGAGGHGRVVADSAHQLGWDVTFFDDSRTGDVDGWRIGGRFSDIEVRASGFDGAIVAIGNNRARLGWSLRLKNAGIRLVTIADAASRVSSRARIGEGTFFAAGAVINVGVEIGLACIINTSASVDHDCVLSDGVHLSPGVHLSGAVSVGSCAWLGTGTAVRNDRRIGANVVAGVGSVIVKDVADGLIVAGVPAKPLEKEQC